MLKQIVLNDRTVCYNLEYKKVKNINIRIKSDGIVYVSAAKVVSEKYIQELLIKKSDFILRAVDKFKNTANVGNKVYFTEAEIKSVINDLCLKVYPYYEKMGIAFPVIKFRKMTSMWGSCRPHKGVLTFNINLMFAPMECAEYVVWHEFTHFLHNNHSDKFYNELSKVCFDWKERKEKLKNINLR